MKNQEFEVKLLVKQNTQMAVKLQSYRKENQQLVKKNQNLNCWVQNLSEVFAYISAAWKTITDNEQAFYTLIRKKTDPNAKAILSKYISHFKAFDEIITNLGDKITNEGHSEAATIDAKSRLASFVSNYNMFFMEYVEAYFKFNDEYLAYINQKTEGQTLQQFTMQLRNKQIENRTKIKQFESYFGQFRENLKIYENYNQHKLLDGIILQKNKEIDFLKNQNLKKSRKIAYMVDYSTHNISSIIENQDVFTCTCGAAQLNYYNKTWEQHLKNLPNASSNQKQQSQAMIDEGDENLMSKLNEYQDFNAEKDLLYQRNVQCLSKLQKLKLQYRLTEEIVLQSPVFISLKEQFNDLVDYTNSLVTKLNKNYDYLNELERIRLEEIEDLKKKYEKPIYPSRQQQPETIVVDHKLLINFRDSVLKEMANISGFYQSLCKDGKEREDKLSHVKQLMKSLKRQNDDLNRKLNDLQEKMAKSVDHLQYRHSKFNELEAKVVEMFRSQPHSQDCDRLKKLWDEYVDYVKTRDKKIKAMEDQIRKKDKQIAQKNKLEEVFKTALSQTQAIYVQSKEKLDKFEQFKGKVQKEILNLSEENYKMKIEIDQQRNFMNIRLKNQVQVKSKLEEKVKFIQKIQAEMKVLKEKEIEFDRKFQEFSQNQKENLNKLRIQLMQKEKQVAQLSEILQQRDKSFEKIIEDKEKKNLEINKLKAKLKAIEQNNEYEVLLMEIEGYKSKIMCSCGAERERQVVLTTCPHIFCKKCIEDTVVNRNRKCPICGVKFTKSDVHEICWT